MKIKYVFLTTLLCFIFIINNNITETISCKKEPTDKTGIS